MKEWRQREPRELRPALQAWLLQVQVQARVATP
jgi:hypothetical protein